MPEPDLAALLAFAHELADDARAIARRWFRAANAEAKADRTPVTAADREIERRWRQRLGAAFPRHGVLGEEEGAAATDAEWLWVLDPIDGTKAFASGNPLFGSLIGLMHRGMPVLGVLEASALGERWAAAHGAGATHNGRAIRARGTAALEQAVLYCTTPDPLAGHAGHARLRQSVAWTVYGGDCIGFALCAMGTADLVVDRGLKPYDWCALVPILQQAGGVLLGWDLQPLSLQSDGAVIAAGNAALAAAASRLVLR